MKLIHCHDFQASEKFYGNENLKSLFKYLNPTGSLNKPQCMQIFIARWIYNFDVYLWLLRELRLRHYFRHSNEYNVALCLVGQFALNPVEEVVHPCVGTGKIGRGTGNAERGDAHHVMHAG